MNVQSGTRTPPSGADDLLANLIEEITQALQRGEPVDMEAYALTYPDHAERLRRLVPAMLLLEHAGAARNRLEATEPMGADQALVSGVLGDFRILREIGRGGMGVVYEAEQISLGRRVALKVLPFAAVLDPRRLQRFQNEAHAAASLKHPNIVRIYSVGCERGVHHYAMEHIEGRTLAEVIDELRGLAAAPAVNQEQPTLSKITADLLSGGRGAEQDQGDAGPAPAEADVSSAAHISSSEETARRPQANVSTKPSGRGREFFRSVAQLGMQAAEALEHAHQMGVVHRDIKPSNLMIDAQGHLWITDFGLAMTQQDLGLTMTGDILGTLRYMSPEQAQGQHRILDHRTDIYSLGVTLYEMLTLEPPFTSSDRHALLHQIVDGHPRPPRQITSAIPRDLETIVLKALAAEPQARYVTAQDMADDLKRFLADEPIHARRPSWRKRLAYGARRHPRVATALLLLLAAAVLLGLPGLVWWQQQRAAVVTAVEDDLQLVQTAMDQERWPEARQALDRAQVRLAGTRHASLDAQVQEQQRNLDMVAKLEEARMASTIWSIEGWNRAGSDRTFAEAFAGYGLDVQTLEPQEAVRRIRGSGIRKQLIRALDYWSFQRSGLRGQSGDALRALAQQADDDPWRHEFRKVRSANDLSALVRLAEAPEALEQPLVNMQLLAHSLMNPATAQPCEKLLRRAQRRYPGDFWLNAWMGQVLGDLPLPGKATPERAAERAGFYRAALASHPSNLSIRRALALTLSTQGRAEQAVEELQQSVKDQPDSALAHMVLGELLKDQGKQAEAIEEFRLAVKCQSDSARTHSQLGLALKRQGKLAEAIEEYRLAIQCEPDIAEIHHNLGNALADQGKLAEAIDAYRLAISLQPHLALPHVSLGLALRRQGQRAEAINEFRWAVKIQPDLFEAHYALGIELSEQGQQAESIEEFRLAIKYRPDDVDAHGRLGVALVKSGLRDEAIAEFRAAVRLKPDSAQAHLVLGSSLAQLAMDGLGTWGEAIPELREAVRLKPDHAGAHQNLGTALAETGLSDEAIAEYQEAIRLNPDNAMTHHNLGNALRDNGALDQALIEYREALRLGFVETHAELAVALQKKGKLDEAVAECREAIRLKPSDAEGHNNLGNALMAKGEPDEAIAAYREAIRLKPDYAEAHCQLGLLLSDKGLSDEALNSVRLGHELGSRIPRWQYARHYRYNAARSAALAGCGEGDESNSLDEAARQHCRRQALDWLRAELGQCTDAIAAGQPEACPSVVDRLQHWQRDCNLAGVRDAEALAKLPDAEQQSWREFWAEVATLTAKATKTGPEK